MPALTPQFLFQYEKRMRAITEAEYLRKLTDKATWWNKVSKTITTEGKAERITWLLSTAMIEPTGLGGNLTFEDIVAQTVEYPVSRHGKGIKVQRDQIEDLDGTGLSILADWSAQVGADSAYYPQREMAQIVLNGAATDGSAVSYDGKPFFAVDHPLNPFDSGSGVYCNWFHGAAAGVNPGALPIDDSVNVDVALTNLGKALASISGIKMPNGVDPRFLTPLAILAPPRMVPRVQQLTNAKFIAQAAGASGGGGADVTAIIANWGLAEPIEVKEFASTQTYSFTAPNGARKTVTGSDTSYFILCQEAQTSQLGALVNVQRKPFKVTYYTGDSGGTGLDAVLDRANELEYHIQGRRSAQYGHPYALIRVDAT